MNKNRDKSTTGNGIGDEGAKAMCEMLKVNTTLTGLYLGGKKKERKKIIQKDERETRDSEWDWI